MKILRNIPLRNAQNETVGFVSTDQKIIILKEYFHLYRESLIWFYDIIYFVII